MSAIAALHDRIEELAIKVEVLEDRFNNATNEFIARGHADWRGLDLSSLEAVLLDALSNGKVWTSEQLLNRIDAIRPGRREGRGTGTVLVHICRIRKKLRACDPPIALPVIRHRGYRLPDESVARLASMRVA